MSNSDEEIQEELDRSDLSYRTGWPQLPALPVTTEVRGARNVVENASDILLGVRTILDILRIHFFDVFFAFRIPRDADPTMSHDAYLTLVVTIDSALPNNLQQPVIQIRQHLKRHESTADIFIELIDHRALDSLVTLPICHSDTLIINAWPEVSKLVRTALERQGAEWLCIEVAQRGLLKHRCSPTVIITTPTASSRLWSNTIVPDIRTQLRQITPLFGVEIMCALSLITTNRREPLAPSAYNSQVVMGASIGLTGDDRHAGTVGGYVSLEDGQTYGLTNHHVVRDDRMDGSMFQPSVSSLVTADTILVIKATSEMMLRPGSADLRSAPQLLNCPADRDHNEYITQLTAEYHTWESQSKKGNPQASTELARVASQRTTALNSARTFASVFSSSGFRTADKVEFTGPPARKFLLDWALLSIDESRTTNNLLPRTEMRLEGAMTGLVKGYLCDTWSPLNTGKMNLKRHEVDVVKHGRTTDWTFGSINCGLATVNPKADPAFKEMAKTYGLSNSDTSHCYSIIKRGKRDFVDAGDSGSIVVHDPSGTWLGLLFGESGASSGLMVPMNIIFDDIKLVTGSAVVAPTMDLDP